AEVRRNGVARSPIHSRFFRTISMAHPIPRAMSAAMTRKLHRLAEQRCLYFIELHQSGRWRHYYTAAELAAQMREAAQLAERWQEMLEIASTTDAARSPVPVQPTQLVSAR